MCLRKALRDRRSKNIFCGERELGSYDAPLDQTPRPRRKPWPVRTILIETRLNPLKTLGRLGRFHVALVARVGG